MQKSEWPLDGNKDYPNLGIWSYIHISQNKTEIYFWKSKDKIVLRGNFLEQCTESNQFGFIWK